ncbi:MAG: FG-GAP-like repeat-containing protein [Verrucomicrobiota bacterium]|nr:FG-GAP-like repeat-containing protein [Verrucomicrobiota bacterium]
MRKLAGIAGMLLAAGCGQDTPPPAKPAGPSATGMVPAVQVQKQADGLFYRAGKVHPFTGRTEATHTNGVQRGKFEFHAGRPEGVWREWHPNGKPRRKVVYTSGKLHGEFVEWHANGRVKSRATFAEGNPHGDWNEWDATGLHAVQRKYQHGLMVSEVMPVELMQRVSLITQLRARFDRLVWQREVDAQRFHETLVAAWDALRAAKDKFSVLEKFQFGSLEIGSSQKMNPSDWKEWLKALQVEGWEIQGTHWRHEQFTFQDKKAVSRYSFTVRALNGQRRVVLRGLLSIHWTEAQDAQERFLPGRIKVSELRREEREGALGFAEQPAPQGGGPVLAQDLNLDGLPEIIFPAINAVHWNRGGWKFEPGKLCAVFPERLTAAVLADFTGDGVADLLGVPVGGAPWLWAGTGKGKFNKPTRAITSGEEWHGASACAAGDVDGDGDLDVWITNHKPPFVDGQFPLPYFDANDGHPSRLLLNGGTGKFTEAIAPGLRKLRRTRSSSWVDLDGDGDLDLLNVADFGGLDHYANDGRGEFTDLNGTTGNARYGFGQGHTVGDFNGDGLPDVFMAGVDSAAARRLSQMKLGHKSLQEFQARRTMMGGGNRLFLGSAKGLKFKQSKSGVIERTGWASGVSAADFDLDGDRDIFVATGFSSRRTAEDYDSIFWRHDIYTQNNQPDVALAAHFKEVMGPVRESLSWHGFQPNALLLNDGQGGWREAGFLLGAGSQRDGRSVVTADFDADGRPDILITERHWDFKTGLALPHVRLLANHLEPEGGWIGAHLRGAPGRSPIGAMVTARAGKRVWRHWVLTGDSLAAQHPFTAHFGFGKIEAVDSLEVRWPDGRVTRLAKPLAGKYHILSAAQAKLEKASKGQ